MHGSTERPISGSAGRWLVRVLKLHLVISALSLGLTLLHAALPSAYEGLNGFAGPEAELAVWVGTTAIVLFGAWVYRLHVDLFRRFPGYPTTPGRALAQCFIPVYFFWGVPATFRTLASRLTMEGGALASQGQALDKSAQWLLFTAGAALLLARIASGARGTSGAGNGLFYELLISAGVLVLAIAWLRITLIVTRVVAGWEQAAVMAGPAVPATAGQTVPATAGQTVPATAGQTVPATAGQTVPATAGQTVPATAGQTVPAPVVATTVPLLTVALICGGVTFAVVVFAMIRSANVSQFTPAESGYQYNALYQGAACVGMLAAPFGAAIGTTLYYLGHKLRSRVRGR